MTVFKGAVVAALVLGLAACAGRSAGTAAVTSTVEASTAVTPGAGNIDLCVTLQVASLRRVLASSATRAEWVAGMDDALLDPVRTEWACNWLDGADRLTAGTRAMEQVMPEYKAKFGGGSER